MITFRGGNWKLKIDVIISADDIKDEKIVDKSVVIVDMLRATSVITTAMDNGCKAVIPVLTVEEALEIAGRDRKKYILGGERNALKIPEFDCSNSPLEYTREVVKDKILIMTTTNGTRAIKRSAAAKNMLIGALINGAKVADKLVSLRNDVTIVNSGTSGQFSMDDFICSGYIIKRILEKTEVELTDISKTALYVYEKNPDIVGFIQNASHYKRIQQLDLYDDLKYCCKKDIIKGVPEYLNGVIKLL